MHVALLTDFPAVSFANGVSLATQSLKRHLEMRGHRVTLIGPRPTQDDPEPCDGTLLLEAAPFKPHPGVNLAFAWPPQAFGNEPHGFDVVHSQANSLLLHWAPMMRRLHGIPCISTHTLHMPGFVHHGLPTQLAESRFGEFMAGLPARGIDRLLASGYNWGDGLIVQCEGLAQHWRTMGLRVPLHVIPRPIDTTIFDTELGDDPFRSDFVRGKRIIMVARHAKEKSIPTLMEAFAWHVLPRHPDASLTLVGNGQEHEELQKLATKLGIMNRCDFPGEKPQKELRHYYGHADVFGYASVTETYGQVIAEALWCGLPVAALADGLGVSFQVEHERNGLLCDAGEGERERLGAHIDTLLMKPTLRRKLSANAAKRARQRVAPEIVYRRYEEAYETARAHLADNPPEPFEKASPAHWSRLLGRHVVPWTAQQSLLLGLGALRGKRDNYSLPKVRIDGPAEEVHQSPSSSSAERFVRARRPRGANATRVEAH